MGRLVHIALKCASMADLEKSTKFYEQVMGIYQTKTGHDRGHLSRHMTDGIIDLALMVYDSEDEKEAKLSGPGACIHHIGIEVTDRPSMIEKIEKNGGRIFSDRAEGALKFFSPDGTLAEIVGVGRYKKKEKSSLARIANVALKVNDLELATKFYKNVFDFREIGTEKKGGTTSRRLTDGEHEITLLHYADASDPAANLAAKGPCIHHWGIEVPDRKAAAQKVDALGGKLLESASAGRTLFRTPDGSVCEIADAGSYAR